MDRYRTVKTATARATEAIEAAEMMFADEMGAALDLSPAARMALIEKIAATIESGRLPPSPRIRTLRAIGAKLQTTLFRSLTTQTADAEVG